MDCPKNSDESNCSTCAVGFVKCNETHSTQCIKADKVCNGISDCNSPDDDHKRNDLFSSDEHNCTECQGLTTKCKTINQCIKYSQVCDGVADCRDKSDELVCDNCFRERSFKCPSSNSKCVDTCEPYMCGVLLDALVCKALEQCEKYNSTELFCCDFGKCLIAKQVCDGVVKCEDMTDEMNCESKCTENRSIY